MIPRRQAFGNTSPTAQAGLATDCLGELRQGEEARRLGRYFGGWKLVPNSLLVTS